MVVFLVVLGLFTILGLTLPGFLTVGNLLNLVRSVAALGILGVAMAIVVIGRGLNLSLVASTGVGTALALHLMAQGAPTSLAIGVGIGLVALVGLVNGLLIAFVEIPALFATLATGLLVYGLARATLLDDLIIEVPPDRALVRLIGQGRPLGIPMPIVLFAFVALAIHLLLTRTVVGRFIYAHGDNAESAALTGIPVRPLTVLEYLLSATTGLLAGLVIAGSVNGFNLQVVTSSLIFDVVLVVVIGGVSLVGGRGGVVSVVVGTAFVGLMLNGMTLLDMNVHQQNIGKGMLLLGAIVLDNRLHPRDEETVRQGD